MIKDLELLKQFGLTTNDIKIYSCLFSLGRSKTGPIISTSKITSSRVYASLQSLITKGLVSYEVKNNIKYYKAELPDQLITEAEKNTQALRKLATEIHYFPIEHNPRNETNTYEGAHGFRTAFLQHVQKIKKNETVCAIAFSHQTATRTNFKSLRNLFAEIDELMFSRTKNFRMLLDKKLLPQLKAERTHYKRYSLKFLPSGYFSPMAINISEQEVLLLVWGDTPTVFTMRNKAVVHSFKKNFEFLWNIAKTK